MQRPMPSISPKTLKFDLPSAAPFGAQASNKYKEQNSEFVRFSILPRDRRPEVVARITDVDDDEEEEEEGANSPCGFIAPEPLSAPQIGLSDDTMFASTDGGRWQPPKSSPVPSYILAGTNRFARSEIDSFMPRTNSLGNFAPVRPLFVYGNFMFPSVLRHQAARFASEEGFYSERNQRRLRSDFSDWGNIDSSLQHVAEKMTPAILKGYERWKPRDFTCAAIQRVRSSSSTTEKFSVGSYGFLDLRTGRRGS